MRWNSFIPVAKTATVEIRFAILGNWNYDAEGTYLVYTREPVIARVELLNQTTAQSIIIESVNGDFPDATFRTTAPDSSGKIVMEIDVTPYVIAETGGGIGIKVLGTGYEVDFDKVDGLPPHSLPVGRSQIIVPHASEEGVDVGFMPVFQYGKIPSRAYVGDIIEVLAPIDLHETEIDMNNYTVVSNWNNYIKQCLEDTALKQNLWYINAVSVEVQAGQLKTIPSDWKGTVQLLQAHYEWDEGDTAGGSPETENPQDYASGQFMKVETADECSGMVRVKWNSRCGNGLQSWWRMIERKEDTISEIDLQTLNAEYTGSRGVGTTIVLRKDNLTADDVYYYSSIIAAGKCGVELRGGFFTACKVVTKQTDSVICNDGDLYQLDVEVKLQEYGAY